MPLLRITSGDLGTKAGEAEKKIQEAFRLASAWKAIILLDEADVFLAKRKTGDIGRNAFVTIFLTSMEYYAGTLMLTTNQPDVFDEAVQSRIHLQIAYPPLNASNEKPFGEMWSETKVSSTIWMRRHSRGSATSLFAMDETLRTWFRQPSYSLGVRDYA
jgi:hypothetical protein